MVYYNEHDPKAAAWLRELVKHNLIAQGEVDERSILDVCPGDLAGFEQCHFFAGIGGWSVALRFAGWRDDQPVWTGSCPCQPFSTAGKGRGAADERHLWPAWFHLIGQCRPARIFGEQVTAALRRGWLDLVQADLEGIGYRIGAAGLPAASVGAPHIRDRLWFVADSEYPKRRSISQHRKNERDRYDAGRQETYGQPGACGEIRDPGELEHHDMPGEHERAPSWEQSLCNARHETGAWSNAEWLACRDDKARPVEPGTFPLAHGLPARMGRLRGYGNAIVPQVAAEFIKAYRFEC